MIQFLDDPKGDDEDESGAERRVRSSCRVVTFLWKHGHSVFIADRLKKDGRSFSFSYRRKGKDRSFGLQQIFIGLNLLQNIFSFFFLYLVKRDYLNLDPSYKTYLHLSFQHRDDFSAAAWNVIPHFFPLPSCTVMAEKSGPAV